MANEINTDNLAAAKAAGAAAAARALTTKVPDHPLLRVAWAAGFREPNPIHDAVQQARAAGATWRQIGEALGENPATAETKYGTGLERMRRYRARKKSNS